MTSFRAASRHLLGLAAACCFAALPALAQDLHGDPSGFNLFNDSGRVMIAFAVELDSGDYTENLLDQPMQPGIGRTMDLQGLLDGACDHRTRIVWAGGKTQDVLVPYCTIASLSLTDTEVLYD